MKRIDKIESCLKSIVISLSLLLLVGSCTKNEIDSQPETPDYFTVTATVADEISFGENAVNKFLIESSVPWDATVVTTMGDDWCTLSGYSSDEMGLEAEVYIVAAANLSTDQREATITITADGFSTPEVLTVTQMGYGAEIVVSESALSVISVAGATATFTVTSTSAWEIKENEHFTFDPSSGEGDPYLTEEPTVVTATAKATNTSSTDDIVTEMSISNSDGKSATIIFTQQKSVALSFADASALTAAAEGETFEIEVTTDSEAWQLYCSSDDVEIDYSSFEEDGTVAVTVGKNTTFGSRTMTLSLKTDDGLVESAENITVSQETYNSDFDYISYMISGSYTLSEGVLTLTNTGSGKTRISSKSNTYGMGTYTFLLDYNGDDSSYINFHAQDTGTDLFNLAIGSGSSASYFRNTANTINNPPSIAATTAHLNAMNKMVISVLPDATDGTKMNLVVELSNDEGVLYNYTLQTTNYYTADPTFTNDMYLYFGVCSTASGSNTLAVSSFDFEAYDSTAIVPDADGGDESYEGEKVPFSLFTDMTYLNGAVTLINDGDGMTLTHTSGTSSRVAYATTDLLFGTYHYNFSDYQGSSDSYLCMQLDIDGYTTDRVILNVGPGAPVSIVKVEGTVVNSISVTPTLAQMEAMEDLIITILPKAGDDTKMEVITTLYDASGDLLYTKTIENNNYSDSVAPYNIMYFGIFGTASQSFTVDYLAYDAYSATSGGDDPAEDGGSSAEGEVVPLSLFSDTSWLNGTVTTINDGDGVTLTHTSGTSSRVAYATTDLLFGTYNFNISDYQGSSDTYFNMHLDINGYTTDRVILYVGPGAPVSIVKVDGTVVNTVSIKPTLEQMTATENLVVSILPKADDDSKVEVTTTLYDASGAELYTQTIENINYSDSTAPYDIMYFGLFGTPSQSITIESLTYDAYSASSDPDTSGDGADSTSDSVVLDFATLNYTSYLNGSYSINNNGSLTITHSSAAQSRFTTENVEGMSVFGMGTYTIEFSDYSGTDDSFINLQAVSSSSSAEQYNINIGPSAAQSVLKSSVGLWAAVTDLKPSIDELKAMKTLTISLLPVETNTNNMNLTVSIDGTVLSSTGGMANFAVTNADFINEMTLYFGVGGSTTGSSITIDSFSFAPYVAEN